MSKVLFMPVGFFEYDRIIEQEMRNMGHDVTTFSPMASYGDVLQKIKNTLSKGKYIKKRAYRLQKKFYNECTERFDYIVAIVGRDINAQLFFEFKKKQSKAQCILYLWDDIARMENFKNIEGLFDKIYSFDTEDVKKYGFHFLPLFYTSIHENVHKRKKYLLSMIGTMHSGRLYVWNTIVDKLKIKEESCFLYLLAGSIKDLLEGKKNMKSRNINSKCIHIYGLTLQEAAIKMAESKIAVDVQFGSQSGLTMRTIESIATETKLITTNPYVKGYDFYNPNNICIIDKKNPIVSKEFLDSEYEDIPEEIVRKYSLHNWIAELLR